MFAITLSTVQRSLMLGMISSGVRNPTWKDTDEGRLVIAFLAKSDELE